MNTVAPSGKNIERNWHVIDGKGLVLGRKAGTNVGQREVCRG